MRQSTADEYILLNIDPMTKDERKTDNIGRVKEVIGGGDDLEYTYAYIIA
jgi:hypothetical protein